MSTMSSSRNGAGNKVCYRAWSKDTQALKQSSSGAVFYELARNVLAEGGVVFGAAFREDGTVFLDKAQNLEELRRLLGSKYVQAETDGVYEEVKKLLHGGVKKVLFCGTPCQCNALFAFLNGKIPDNLILLDFICHGIPGAGVWKKYLACLSEGRRITDLSFRDKRISWGDFGTRVTFEDGTEYFQRHQDDVYMSLFLANRILRPSCHRCRAKGENRVSDVTLGDYWGIRGEEAQQGCSVVLGNTRKGMRLLEAVGDQLDLKEITYDEAVRNNSNYFQSCGIPFNRGAVFQLLNSEPEKVFANPGKYIKTTFPEKVIRKCIRILRNMKASGAKPTYLECFQEKKTFEDRALCCGCGACKAVCPVQAISMEEDEEGFRYPMVDMSQCVHCGKCARVCRREVERREEQRGEASENNHCDGLLQQ